MQTISRAKHRNVNIQWMRALAALGIRITRGVTMHGLSLNCNNTLEHYNHIVACGIDDADVTTLSLELGRDVTPGEMAAPVVRELERALAGEVAVAPAGKPRQGNKADNHGLSGSARCNKCGSGLCVAMRRAGGARSHPTAYAAAYARQVSYRW